MPKLKTLFFGAVVALGIFFSQKKLVSAYCSGAINASRISTCIWVSSANDTTESYYCAVNSTTSGPWSCSGTNSANCRATLGGYQGCSTAPGTGTCTCNCKTTGGVTIVGNCSGAAAQGRACGSGIPYSGSCDCKCNPPLGGCAGTGTSSNLSCWIADSTITPGGGPTATPRLPGPTNLPIPTNTPRPPTITLLPPTNTPIPPTLTPIPLTATPAIIGRIYDDPNDGSVGISGNVCIKNSGTGPTPVSLSNASIKAIRTSNGVVSNGTISGSNYVITSGLVTTAGNGYEVSLVLPTPAGTSTFSYVCGCPLTAGNDYLCQYSSISANGSPNFFVKKNTLANAWWQTVGGSVYARDEIQTQIPISTCDSTLGCASALIVGTGSNTSGFAMLGEGGILRTTTAGEATYVQSAGSRTSSDGGYATGVKPGHETYEFFRRSLEVTPTPFVSTTELQLKVNNLSPNRTGIFTYTGGGDLVIDKTNPSIPLVIPSNRRVVVFVPSNLKFVNSSSSSSSQITSVPTASFLMFVTQGNILIDPSVGYLSPTTVPNITNANLTGVFVADKQIIIQSDGDTTVADRKFIGAGTFVAWDLGQVGNGVQLQRNFADSSSGTAQNSTTPTEVFVYRPDFTVHFPIELKTAQFNWQETAPQRVIEP